MKKLKCLDCAEVFEAESSEEMLNKMQPHYMSEHKDIMAAGDKNKQKAWFEKFNKDWEEAEEV